MMIFVGEVKPTEKKNVYLGSLNIDGIVNQENSVWRLGYQNEKQEKQWFGPRLEFTIKVKKLD